MNSAQPSGNSNGRSAARVVAAEMRSQAGDFDDPRILEVVTEYEDALRTGKSINRSELINRYSGLAKEVAACLDGLDMVYQAGPLLGGSGSSRRGGQPVRDANDKPLNAEGTPLGDFQIVRELARGGMGVVYEAIQLSLGRRVALKVLPFAATIDERQLQRFKLEAQAAALLHHNHIVPIYAVGCERGVHYYAMQLIDGQSLAVVIRQLAEKDRQSTDAGSGVSGTLAGTQSLDPGEQAERAETQIRVQTKRGRVQASEAESEETKTPQAEASTLDVSRAVTAGFSVRTERYVRRVAQIIAQAADALEHAHQAGVVHRDVKPANLLVDKAGKIWVADFGLAQIQADLNLTRSGDMLGTLRYMSPEQAGGQKTLQDHRTDIYSLGATFYELLTLEPVFNGETHSELLYQILNGEPRGLRERNRAIPHELETIVLKALSKNPADRYQSTAAFSADIKRYLLHQPILARRPTMVDRARKWSRRHPAVVIAGGLMFAVIAVALLISNRLISQEQRKTEEAWEQEKIRADEAERSYRQAREAVDALFRISEEELADQGPPFARRRILEVVLSHYEDFIDLRRDDPKSQAELAAAQESVKRILHELNVLQQAMRLNLLAQSGVQRELNLEDAQRERLMELLSTWRKADNAYMESLAKGSSEVLEQERLVAAEKLEAELGNLLTAPQMVRFKQLAIQDQGVMAFREPEIIDVLQLSDDQRKQIRNLERTVFVRGGPDGPGGGRGRGNRGGGRGGRSSNQNQREARMREPVGKVLELLTDQQREGWSALTGAPFNNFEDHRWGGNRFPDFPDHHENPEPLPGHSNLNSNAVSFAPNEFQFSFHGMKVRSPYVFTPPIRNVSSLTRSRNAPRGRPALADESCRGPAASAHRACWGSGTHGWPAPCNLPVAAPRRGGGGPGF